MKGQEQAKKCPHFASDRSLIFADQCDISLYTPFQKRKYEILRLFTGSMVSVTPCLPRRRISRDVAWPSNGRKKEPVLFILFMLRMGGLKTLRKKKETKNNIHACFATLFIQTGGAFSFYIATSRRQKEDRMVKKKKASIVGI